MSIHALIDRHYAGHDLARGVLIDHSRQVAELAVATGRRLRARGWAVDLDFVAEAAWLHDIGMLQTNVPQFGCAGTDPYIRHGLLGAELVTAAGLPRHALVCERHIGVGLSCNDIRDQQLPLPLRDMRPQTLEEQIITYADLFFSKQRGGRRSLDEVRSSLARRGEEKVAIFDAWHARFDL